MQRELQSWLAAGQLKFVSRGDIVETPGCGAPFAKVLHAVAVDGFYQSSPAVVSDLVGRCLARCAEVGAVSVTLTALATGYGRLTMREFASALVPLVGPSFGSVRRIGVCVKSHKDAADILAVVPGIEGPRFD
jgi:hypothetical protein